MTPRARLITASVLFSTGGTAIKGVSLGGWEVLAARAAIASVVVFVLLPEARRGFEWRTLLVGCAYGATTTLFVLSNKLTTAANAVFLQNTSPLFILPLAPLVLRERVSRGDLAFMGVLAVGMLAFFTGVDARFATAPNPLLGNALAACSALTWALTIVGYRWLAARGLPIGSAAIAGNVLACAAALPFALPFGAARPTDWLLLAYLGTVQLGVAYRLIARGLPHVRALEASLILLMEPVLGSIWAWLVFQETLGPMGVAGAVIIVGATVVHSIRSRPQPEAVPEA
jgi:drug/metabolite transporter (DMT)-like permease